MPSWHLLYSYCTYLWYRIITKGTSIREWLRGRLPLHATLATMGFMPIMGLPGRCRSPPNISRVWQTWGMAPRSGVPTRAPTPNPLQLIGGRMGEQTPCRLSLLFFCLIRALACLLTHSLTHPLNIHSVTHLLTGQGSLRIRMKFSA